MLPIGVYSLHNSAFILYENEQYFWPDGTTNIPDALPACYNQTCYVISMSSSNINIANFCGEENYLN